MLDEKDLQAIARLMRDMEDRLDAKMETRLADTVQSLRQEIVDTVQSLRQEIRQEIAETRHSLQQEIAETKQSLQQEIAETKQSLQQEIRQEIADAKSEIMSDTRALIADAKSEIMRGAHVLMEQEFRPQFNLLAEGQQIILEKIKPIDDIEDLQIRVSALESKVEKNSREIALLKKAQ